MLGLDRSRLRIFSVVSLGSLGLLGACGPGDDAQPGADETGAATSAATEDGPDPTTTGTTAGASAGETTIGSSTGETTGAMGLEGACAGALSDSYLQWQAARDAAPGEYTFTIIDELVFADLCRSEVYLACETTTTISVEDGQVVARSFNATPREGTPPEDCPEAFNELGADIGTHADGYPATTFDGVYTECCDLVQAQGGYHTGYDDEYLPGDVVVTFGAENYVESCTARYCDDCGCSGGPTWRVDGITLEE